MKRLALFCLAPLFAAAPLFAQDDSQEVLKNANFSDGTTYWHGDVKPAASDLSNDLITNPSDAKGIMIELHSTSWTSVTQELRAKVAPPSAVLTITYQVSPDFKLSNRGEDYGNCGPVVGFSGANIPSEPGKLVAFVDVPPLSRASMAPTGGGYNQVTIYYDPVSYAEFAPSTDSSPQTVTVQMRPPAPTGDVHQMFCIAFPPGHGTITITKISMVPSSTGTSPNP